jgi:hypothetical protein
MTCPSDALVVFGITGDLAYKQVFPALQAMIQRGHLDVPIVGVAKDGNLEQLRIRSPDFAVWIPLLVGAAAHLVLSVLFGLVFVFLVAGAYQLAARVPLLLIYGVLYGLGLWELNVLTVLHLLFPQLAPLFGLANQIWNGIVAYAIFYGLVLGAYVAVARPGVVASWKCWWRACAPR